MTVTETPSVPVAQIAYGKSRIPLRMDPALAAWDVISPRQEPALADPAAGFRAAAASPISAPPLGELARPGEKVVIVTCDGTRPVPNRQLIPWILDELRVPAEDVTVLLGTGTHRPNTDAEIAEMFGADCVRRVRIVNHNCFEPAENAEVGRFANGDPVSMNRLYVEADKRIVVGFIEPHFFAGFSGGAKGIVPAIAGLETILHLHRFDVIGHPNSAYGVTVDNPTRDTVREAVALRPPEFMVNVTLNADKEITEFFLGDYIRAHDAGCEHVRAHAMVPVERPYPVVVTSNSGFPLDQNLYQSVKALSVAVRIVEPGGTIVLVSECSDGFPSHGNFAKFFREGLTPGALLDDLRARQRAVLDQWQAQTLANVASRAEIAIYSAIPDGALQTCFMTPVADVQSAVEERLGRHGANARVAVLPEGPLTIPYVWS